MRTKLFLAALCLFLAPLFFAPSSPQFSAYAGGWLSWGDKMIPCECSEMGCSGGTCGESLISPESNVTSQSGNVSVGSEALFALAALMLWLRFRAN